MRFRLCGECGKEWPSSTELPLSNICACELFQKLAIAKKALEEIELCFDDFDQYEDDARQLVKEALRQLEGKAK